MKHPAVVIIKFYQRHRIAFILSRHIIQVYEQQNISSDNKLCFLDYFDTPFASDNKWVGSGF